MNILICGVHIVTKFYHSGINIIMMMYGVLNAKDFSLTDTNGPEGLILKLEI